MVAAREPRSIVGGSLYDEIIKSIDWNRVLIQGIGLHAKEHPLLPWETCGNCLKTVLLRREE